MPNCISVKGDTHSSLKKWCKENKKQIGPTVDRLITDYLNNQEKKK